MVNSIDYSIATSEQIEEDLGRQLENIRLTRNITQGQLAQDAGVSVMTIVRLEKGHSASLNTFVRVLIALGLQGNLQNLLPNPSIRPVERVQTGGYERKRARPKKSDTESAPWKWGDETPDRR